jgi:hypothetical protein
MTIFWPAFIGGLLVIAIGLGVTSYRKRLASANADAQRATFGNAGARVARNSTPTQMTTTGIGMIVVGVIGVVLSLLNLDW